MSTKKTTNAQRAAKATPKTAKPALTSSSPVKSAKSAAASAKTVKTPSARKQSASGKAKPSAAAKPKDNAAKSVRTTTPTSASQAPQEAFQVASEALLSLTKANFAALRAQVKKAKDNAKGDHATTARADEDLTAALKRLEAGYRELLRGK
jgi:hypothetical protein